MGAQTAKDASGVHSLKQLGRETLEIAGVTDVVSFDERAVVLATTAGSMTVDGAQLHIHLLDTDAGQVALNGRIDAITYYDAESGEKRSGLLGKLFR